MRKHMVYFSYILGGLIFFLFPSYSEAHEAYVLTPQHFHKGLKMYDKNPLGPLFDSSHLKIFIFIGILIALSYAVIILYSTSRLAKHLDNFIRCAGELGPFVIRLTVGLAFFYAAQINVILGPELSLSVMRGGEIIRVLLFAIAVMLVFGVFTEIAGLLSFILLLYTTHYFGMYMFTYANYFAELFILIFFGSRFLSVDQILFGKNLWWKNLEKYKKWETPGIRIFYGLALAYAGYNVKFVHQNLTVDVYNQYHLAQFFHSTAGFIAAGAGLSEILIGLFIILGFATRWTILISLAFITLSLLYFHEMLWPHLVLYGISISLLINSADFLTIDHYLTPWLRSYLPWNFTAKTIGKKQ